MPETRLREMLDELRREIEQTGTLAEPDRRELHDAVEQIERALGEESAPGIGERLADRALALEAAHPAITEVVDRILRQLSRMGI